MYTHMSITREKKLPKDFDELDLSALFVEEIWSNVAIANSVKDWDQFALGWAFSKGVEVRIAQNFVRRYSGGFNPVRAQKDAA